MASQYPMLRRNVNFDTMLKYIDEEYITTLINFAKYKIVMFAMAKLMEMEIIEQNCTIFI